MVCVEVRRQFQPPSVKNHLFPGSEIWTSNTYLLSFIDTEIIIWSLKCREEKRQALDKNLDAAFGEFPLSSDSDEDEDDEFD